MNDAVLTQRRWLEFLIEQGGAALGQAITITDAGYDFTGNAADLVYERNGSRFEVTIKELPR